ncbi:MAG: type IIA DNA topoisomerase subunit B [Opitutales bacterium]|jgi:topoisomerase IV subunit B|nr:type IIA DNA topoisomerase subunit B [Opitutales bacterium]MBT6379933.1 type IIA DNA topoisomerase subunit B [Opitutales bacterium]
MAESNYTESSIKSLSPQEHIRLRPGMYIGKLGSGASPDDGIYVLLKEIIDNSIDEHSSGHGKRIDITIGDEVVSIRDFGRGIPLGKLVDCVSKINTGAKYDSETFQKSVGLNGVGTKAVNALSSYFLAESYRESKMKQAIFSKGDIQSESRQGKTDEKNGTYVEFTPDRSIFSVFDYRLEYVETMLWNYAYLNTGLTLSLNGKTFRSENGLKDLLENNLSGDILYPIIHLKGEDIEVAMTHGTHYGEEYFSFVNGQHTTMGGTHQAAFRESIVKTIREFFKKDYDSSDIRTSILSSISIRVQEPVFESQTKTKLGSQNMGPKSPSIRNFINNFIKKELDLHLHQFPETAKAIQQKIVASEKERKELTGIRKLAREKAKKVNLHNKKLRDCRAHFNTKHKQGNDSTLFIVEGDSAGGSITKTRDVNTQAVFSLKGKPLNAFGLTKKIVYQNDEFNCLQSALDIEQNLESLRYNKVIIATDADVDGMHIRLLLLTFFLQFFPDLVRQGHLYILETPLFRVRTKKKTVYCYTEAQKNKALEKMGKSAEITRFKGLGEASPAEFATFIGPKMKLEHVTMKQLHNIDGLLSFYMGKNTPLRQGFIIDNLHVEKDLLETES